jgi:capsular polysaccharide biosynthesis protein
MDETVRMAVLGRVLRRQWRLLVALAVAGALLGAVVALVKPPIYAAVTRVLVQGGDEAEALAAETQIATSLIVLDRTVATLGWDTSGAQLKGSVSVTPADGNVLEISATGTTPAAARDLAAAMTDEYIRFSGELDAAAVSEPVRVLGDLRELVDARVVDLNAAIAERQSAVGIDGSQLAADLEQLQAELADATDGLDAVDAVLTNADPSGRGRISVIEPAVLPVASAPPSALQLVAGGAVMFALLGALGVLVARYKDSRLRHGRDIAAALGAPIVGSVPDRRIVDTVDEVPSPSASGRWRAQLVRLIGVDPRWDFSPPTAHALERAAERLYRQLAEPPTTRAPALVVVPADDVAGHHAVGRLTAAATARGRPVSVLTNSPGLQVAVEVGTDGATEDAEDRSALPQGSRRATAPDSRALLVVDVVASRPIVPACGPVSGALVVVTAGTRTGWELVGIAEACADAGYPVEGVLVVAPIPCGDGGHGSNPPATWNPSANGSFAGVGGR